jgi:XTP/dITP diphosphohydrolase
MSAIVLASSNSGKIREIQAILPNWQIFPQSHFNIPEPEETGSTFIENAIIKARNAAKYSGTSAIADDSGLVVDALNGEPGVHSARYAGVSASDQTNIDKLLADMALIPDSQRQARFICVMVYMRHDQDAIPLIAQGVWEGKILREAIGANGFGYDPVFWVETHQCSSAQLPPELKNKLSHRYRALQALNQQIITHCIQA